MKKQKENFVFFQINNAAAFKTALKTYVPGTITSAATLIAQATAQPLAFVNLAFSQSGLSALGITDNLGDALFSAGQFADAPTLGDDTTTWESVFKGTGIHGVFLIGSDQDSFITTFQNNITTQFGSSLTVLDTIQAAARPGDQAGHERKRYHCSCIVPRSLSRQTSDTWMVSLTPLSPVSKIPRSQAKL